MIHLARREITILVKRDRSKDGHGNGVELTGYNLCWPDGRAISLAFENFCKIGVRYLLGREPPERAKVSMYFYPLASREAPLPRVRPHRLRVLYLRRAGRALHLHLPDDTPTNIVFHLDRDETAVLEWIGARGIPDGGRQWFGFLALTAE